MTHSDDKIHTPSAITLGIFSRAILFLYKETFCYLVKFQHCTLPSQQHHHGSGQTAGEQTARAIFTRGPVITAFRYQSTRPPQRGPWRRRGHTYSSSSSSIAQRLLQTSNIYNGPRTGLCYKPLYCF